MKNLKIKIVILFLLLGSMGEVYGQSAKDTSILFSITVFNKKDIKRSTHSNYVELYIEYYKSQNNNGMPTEVPIYDEGMKIEGFKKLMERTTYDKNGRYQGLYTGEFDEKENEFWDVKNNETNKSETDPNSHANTNKDYANTSEGKLARNTAKNHTKKMLKEFKKAVGDETKGKSNF